MKGSTPHRAPWGWWPSLLTVLSILISKWSQPALCYHMNCSDWLLFTCASVWAVSLKGSRSSGQNQKKVGYSPCWFSSAKPTQPGVKVRPLECNLQRLAPQSALPWASLLCSCSPIRKVWGRGRMALVARCRQAFSQSLSPSWNSLLSYGLWSRSQSLLA